MGLGLERAMVRARHDEVPGVAKMAADARAETGPEEGRGCAGAEPDQASVE